MFSLKSYLYKLPHRIYYHPKIKLRSGPDLPVNTSSVLAPLIFPFLISSPPYKNTVYTQDLPKNITPISRFSPISKNIPLTSVLSSIYDQITTNHKKYISDLENNTIQIVICNGPTGCGKTLFACFNAISRLQEQTIDKIVLVCPIPSMELHENRREWMRSVIDIFAIYYTKSEIDQLITDEKLEILTIAEMRGRTFTNSIVIAEEMEYSSPQHVLLLTTRISINCKIVIISSTMENTGHNGVTNLLEKLNTYSGDKSQFGITIFSINDIIRSSISRTMLSIYQETAPRESENNKSTQTTLLPDYSGDILETNATLKYNVYFENIEECSDESDSTASSVQLNIESPDQLFSNTPFSESSSPSNININKSTQTSNRKRKQSNKKPINEYTTEDEYDMTLYLAQSPTRS